VTRLIPPVASVVVNTIEVVIEPVALGLLVVLPGKEQSAFFWSKDEVDDERYSRELK
jgi:hypothetical protein